MCYHKRYLVQSFVGFLTLLVSSILYFSVNEVGPGRTSWEKTWFASSDVWKIKTDFEKKVRYLITMILSLQCNI